MSDGYTPSTERVRNLFTWAYAWRTEDDIEDGDTDLSRLRETQRAEFDRWLREHDASVLESARNRLNGHRSPLFSSAIRCNCSPAVADDIFEALLDDEARWFHRAGLRPLDGDGTPNGDGSAPNAGNAARHQPRVDLVRWRVHKPAGSWLAEHPSHGVHAVYGAWRPAFAAAHAAATFTGPVGPRHRKEDGHE